MIFNGKIHDIKIKLILLEVGLYTVFVDELEYYLVWFLSF